MVFILRLFGLSVKSLCYNFFMARKLKNILPPSPSTNVQIGRRLADTRKSRGLTQSQLAELIGINQRLVSDYEIGRTSISAEMLSRFCIVLRCSADSIINMKSEISSSPVNLRLVRRFDNIEKLPPSQQKALLQNIDMFLKGAKQA